MKNNFSISVLTLIVSLLILTTACQQATDYKSTKELLQGMKAKNDGKWYQHFTFKQRTLFFDKEGKKRDSAVWYEAVSYPYLFRIDRDLENHNYTIYRSDSTYQFKQDTLSKATNDAAVHLVFKGGLYFVSLDEAMEKLEKYGFNTATFRKDTFMNEPTYVVGDEDSQFWLHAEHFYCMRRISTNPNGKLDVVYEDFTPLGNGWVEQKVTFYFKGTKRMEEFYFDIKEKDAINSKTYNINQNYKWYLDY